MTRNDIPVPWPGGSAAGRRLPARLRRRAVLTLPPAGPVRLSDTSRT